MSRLYKYAIDESGTFVSVDELTRESKTLHKYHCIECGCEMVPVMGGERVHHFRHKNEQCSYESYLHKAAKLRFKQLFDNGDSFVVKYYVHYSCRNRRVCPLAYLRPRKNCHNAYDYKELDLKKHYDKCDIEVPVGGFVADLLLTSNNSKVKKLLLEVCVTHECEDDKKNSGMPIVEVAVREDSDICLPICESEPIDEFFVDRRRKKPKQNNIYGFTIRTDEYTKPIDTCRCLITDELKDSYVEKRYGYTRAELKNMPIRYASPSSAMQKGWDVKTQFMCCPDSCPKDVDEALDLYVQRIGLKRQFAKFADGYWNYVIDYARWKDCIYVITNQGKRHYCIYKVTVVNGKYLHSLIGGPFIYDSEALETYASCIDMKLIQKFDVKFEDDEFVFVGRERGNTNDEVANIQLM